MYKQASQIALRVATDRGPLSVENLWTLPIAELDKLAVRLEKEYQDSGEKSFLIKRTSKSKLVKLQFDIVLDILTTKVDNQAAALELLENKKHNQKIDELIADKKDEELKGKSVAQLLKMKK